MDQETLVKKTSEHFEIHSCGENNPKFKPKARACDRCSEHVVGQRLTIAKKDYEYRDKFWEIRCNSCDFKKTVKELRKFKEE